MDDKKLLVVKIVNQIYYIEKKFIEINETYKNQRNEVLKLEERVNTMKTQGYNDKGLDIEIERLKSVIKNQMSGVTKLQSGQTTLFDWNFLESNNEESKRFYDIINSEEQLDSYKKYNVIICFPNMNQVINNGKHLNLFGDYKLEDSKDMWGNTLDEICIALFSSAEYKGKEQAHLYVKKATTFELIEKISYKDIMTDILINSNEEINSSYLNMLKEENTLTKLIKIVSKEAENKNNILENSLKELNRIIDNILIEKKNDLQN